MCVRFRHCDIVPASPLSLPPPPPQLLQEELNTLRLEALGAKRSPVTSTRRLNPDALDVPFCGGPQPKLDRFGLPRSRPQSENLSAVSAGMFGVPPLVPSPTAEARRQREARNLAVRTEMPAPVPAGVCYPLASLASCFTVACSGGRGSVPCSRICVCPVCPSPPTAHTSPGVSNSPMFFETFLTPGSLLEGRRFFAAGDPMVDDAAIDG